MKTNKKMHLVTLLSLVVSLLSGLHPTVAFAATTNPDLVQACGIDVILVLDESGSIVGTGSGASNISQDVRDGASALIGALADTGANVTVVEFNAHARNPIGWTEVTSGAGGTIATTFDPYLAADGNTTPEGTQYDPEDYGSPDYYTNWEAAFIAVAALQGSAPSGNPPLVVFFTDGHPTAYYDPLGTVGTASVANLVYGTDGTTTTNALNEAEAAADVVKGNGSHIFVVGLPNPSVTESNVITISDSDKYEGPDGILGTADDVAFSEADYTLTSPSELADALRDIAFELCAPSLTLTKWVEEGSGYVKAGEGDWEFSGEVTITEIGAVDGYDWVSPVEGAAGSPDNLGTTQSATTDADGQALFQWNPGSTASPQAWTSQIVFNETPQTGYEFVEASCIRKTLNGGGVTETPFTVSSWPATVSFGTNDIVTCDVYNEFVPNPSLSIDKSASPTTYSAVGELISYSYLVTNDGNVTISGPISVDDDNVDAAATCPAGDLAPGDSLTCTASRTVTQADLDAGSITNIAFASGTDPNGGPVDSPTDSETVDAVQDPSLAIVKSANPATYSAVGELISYSYLVTNDGNVTISGPISVTDDNVDAAATCPAGDLAPGDSLTCTASRTVTQADLDAGSITNIAFASGTDPNGGPVNSPTDSETVTAVPDPAIQIVKSSSLDVGADGIANPGDVINYSFTVTNIGNVTLDNVTVNDAQAGVTDCLIGTMAPGAVDSDTCSGSYVLTQADIDSGSVFNQAFVAGEAPGGDPDDPADDIEDDDTNTEPIPQTPALSVDKALTNNADEDGSGTVSLGDTLIYEITASNDGNVTLNNVLVSDDLTGDSTSCASLAPGATCVLTVTYVVTQADVDAGQILNTGTADSDETPPAEDPNTEPIPQNPSILIGKSPDSQQVRVGVGELAIFTIYVENTGDVSLTDVMVSDPLAPDCDYGPVDLAVGESFTYDCFVTVTGDFTNVATASGADPNGDPVSDDDDAVVDAINPSILISKSPDLQQVLTGSDATFTIYVENDGDVDLTDVMVSDPNAPACDYGPVDLAVGESFSYDCKVTVSGDFTNVATASGNDPRGDSVSGDDDAVVDAVNPSVAIEKSTNGLDADAAPGPEILAGEAVTWEYLVTNDGDVDLTGIVVTDDQLGTICTVDLVAGASTTCSASGTAAAGQYANLGTASFSYTDDAGNTTSGSADDPSHYFGIAPSVAIEKSTNGLDADAAPGPEILADEAVTWEYLVTNDGDVDLTGIVVTDDQLGTICTVDLAAGASTTCSASGTAAAGQYANLGTASFSYTDDAGNTASGSATDPSHYFGADPSFTVAKVCTSEPVPQSGPATYRVTFENTGNVAVVVTADDGIGNFTLPTHQTRTFEVSNAGPFSGSATADNTVTATGSHSDHAGNAWSSEQSDSASCTVGGKVDIDKRTTFEGVDASDRYQWQFAIYDAAGNQLATDTASPGDTSLDFGLDNLVPGQTYTVCELNLPAGWASIWRIDSDGDGIADATILPYNPNSTDNPPQDLGNRCYDLTVSAGGTLVLDIHNDHPGGGPRTPGYWKNWNRVTGGGQAANADRNGGWEAGFWLLEDVLDPTIGGGITWDDILFDGFVFDITNAAVAVDILDQREIGDPDVVGDGGKHSNDAAYTLAMHLMAAQLNFGAGAETCDAVRDAALAGEELLDKYDFDGTGDYLLSKHKKPALKADYALALEYATQLDLYNNGELCFGPSVSISSPADGQTFTSDDASPVTIEASVLDAAPITQVEFFVNGVSLGVDTDGSNGWTMDWDWSTVEDGSYTLMATASNDLGQTGSADVVVHVETVAVDDPPTVGITSPTDGAVVSGASVDITAGASDDNGVTQVEFFVDDTSIGVDSDSSDGWSASWDLTGVADGDYTITATATDDASQTASHSIVVTVNNVPDPTMHVGDLDAETAFGRGGKWDAMVTITIHDVDHNPVANATVSGTWSNGTPAICTTDASGQCTITLSNINKNTDSVNFTVDDVSADGYVYDADANHDPDGGNSDGTVIVIAKP